MPPRHRPLALGMPLHWGFYKLQNGARTWVRHYPGPLISVMPEPLGLTLPTTLGKWHCFNFQSVPQFILVRKRHRRKAPKCTPADNSSIFMKGLKPPRAAIDNNEISLPQGNSTGPLYGTLQLRISRIKVKTCRFGSAQWCFCAAFLHSLLWRRVKRHSKV